MSVERGAAAVRVELSGGVVIVRHGECGTMLCRFMVREGAWDAFWDAMVRTLCEFSLLVGGDAL